MSTDRHLDNQESHHCRYPYLKRFKSTYPNISKILTSLNNNCLLYTSDAADEMD